MKPFTSKHMFGAGSSPLKQAKPKKNVDSPETNALKAKLGAEKDAANQAYRQRLRGMDYNEATGKGGYTKSQTDLYDKVANKGSYDGFGASVNFRTGQTRITDYPEKYVPAKNKNGSSDRIFSKDGKKLIASSSTQDSGKKDYYGGSDYKNPKNDKKMGHQQFRESFIKDSISGQGAKERHVIWAENAKRVSDLYGNQTSKANAGGKKLVKKSPVKQTQPAKKTLGSMAGKSDAISGERKTARRMTIKDQPTKDKLSVDGRTPKTNKSTKSPGTKDSCWGSPTKMKKC
jgi:hypothetical protein